MLQLRAPPEIHLLEKPPHEDSAHKDFRFWISLQRIHGEEGSLRVLIVSRASWYPPGALTPCNPPPQKKKHPWRVPAEVGHGTEKVFVLHGLNSFDVRSMFFFRNKQISFPVHGQDRGAACLPT